MCCKCSRRLSNRRHLRNSFDAMINTLDGHRDLKIRWTQATLTGQPVVRPPIWSLDAAFVRSPSQSRQECDFAFVYDMSGRKLHLPIPRDSSTFIIGIKIKIKNYGGAFDVRVTLRYIGGRRTSAIGGARSATSKLYLIKTPERMPRAI